MWVLFVIIFRSVVFFQEIITTPIYGMPELLLSFPLVMEWYVAHFPEGYFKNGRVLTAVITKQVPGGQQVCLLNGCSPGGCCSISFGASCVGSGFVCKIRRAVRELLAT